MNDIVEYTPEALRLREFIRKLKPSETAAKDVQQDLAAYLQANPRLAQALIERAAIDARRAVNEWWQQLEDTTKAQLANVLDQQLELGTDTGAVIDSLAPLFGETRAMRIAVTETTRAMGQAAMATYEELGVEEWEWHTAEDSLVDKDCEERADDGPYPIYIDFEPAHPNCRCWPVPVMSGERERDYVRDDAGRFAETGGDAESTWSRGERVADFEKYGQYYFTEKMPEGPSLYLPTGKFMEGDTHRDLVDALGYKDIPSAVKDGVVRVNSDEEELSLEARSKGDALRAMEQRDTSTEASAGDGRKVYIDMQGEGNAYTSSAYNSVPEAMAAMRGVELGPAGRARSDPSMKERDYVRDDAGRFASDGGDPAERGEPRVYPHEANRTAGTPYPPGTPYYEKKPIERKELWRKSPSGRRIFTDRKIVEMDGGYVSEDVRPGSSYYRPEDGKFVGLEETRTGRERTLTHDYLAEEVIGLPNPYVAFEPVEEGTGGEGWVRVTVNDTGAWLQGPTVEGVREAAGAIIQSGYDRSHPAQWDGPEGKRGSGTLGDVLRNAKEVRA